MNPFMPKHTVASVIADLVEGLSAGTIVLREPERTSNKPTTEDLVRILHAQADFYYQASRRCWFKAQAFLFPGLVFCGAGLIGFFNQEMHLLGRVLLLLSGCSLLALSLLNGRAASRFDSKFCKVHFAEIQTHIASLIKLELPQKAVEEVSDLMSDWLDVAETPLIVRSIGAKPSRRFYWPMKSERPEPPEHRPGSE